jgi:hypothetical protein
MYKQAQIDFNSYHNTTGLNEAEVNPCEKKAKGQDLEVLNVFCKHKAEGLTAYDVWEIMTRANHKILLTSVRRSIDTLLGNPHKNIPAKIKRLPEKKMGGFGSPNFQYQYIC